MIRGPSPRRVRAPGPPVLPARFPQNTRVYIQTKDGEIFFGPLEYMRGRPVPRWVFNPLAEDDAEGNVYLKMPQGEGLVSKVRRHRRSIHMNDEIYAEHRLFIACGIGSILEAVLHRYNQAQEQSARGLHILVQMENEFNQLYIGELRHFRGHRPSFI